MHFTLALLLLFVHLPLSYSLVLHTVLRGSRQPLAWAAEVLLSLHKTVVILGILCSSVCLSICLSVCLTLLWWKLSFSHLKTLENFWRLCCSGVSGLMCWVRVEFFCWRFSSCVNGRAPWVLSPVLHMFKFSHVPKRLLTVVLAHDFREDTWYALVGLDVFIECKMSFSALSLAWVLY